MYNRLCGFRKNGGYGMKEYFFCILVSSVIGSVCSMLGSGGFEKYIKYIASLVCLLIILIPFRKTDIKEIINDEKFQWEIQNDNSPSDLDNLSQSMTEKRLKEYINEIVFNKFGINPAGVNININWTEDEAIIQEISVKLSKSNIKDSDDIKAHLEKSLGGEVEIIEE